MFIELIKDVSFTLNIQSWKQNKTYSYDPPCPILSPRNVLGMCANGCYWKALCKTYLDDFNHLMFLDLSVSVDVVQTEGKFKFILRLTCLRYADCLEEKLIVFI